MFALIPNSMLDFRILNKSSKLELQIFWETQEILHKARIADLSNIHKVGARKTLA